MEWLFVMALYAGGESATASCSVNDETVVSTRVVKDNLERGGFDVMRLHMDKESGCYEAFGVDKHNGYSIVVVNPMTSKIIERWI
tara:strand:+ start:27124 stop:27378 length:255 start_codon:yes stop_codon:yes gene_type:complete